MNALNETYDRPWSEIGIDVTGQEVGVALTTAGLDFNVSVRRGSFAGRLGNVEALGYHYIVRDDTEVVLGQCKGKFIPLQNSALVDMTQPFIDRGLGVLDTIGTFGNGAKVWAMLKLTSARVDITAHEAINVYLLALNGHDGSTSAQIGIIPTRLSCANMLPMIGKQMIKMKHTLRLDVMKMVSEVYKRLELLDARSLDWVTLASKACNDAAPYFSRVFKLSDSPQALGTLKTLDYLFRHGRGQGDLTWFGAFNAVTEYLNYNIGRSQETRLRSLWLGSNAKTNERAFTLALEMSV